MFATILLSLVVIAVVVLIVRNMLRDKRAGRSSCGGNCAGCSLCAGGSCPSACQQAKQ